MTDVQTNVKIFYKGLSLIMMGRTERIMKYTEKEVLQFAGENDVKFVKLMFCDIFGGLKTVSTPVGRLERVFKEGVPIDVSKDSTFLNITDSDLRLFPDLDTLAVLPWRPQQGRVIRFFCDIKYPDGTPFEGDGRFFLKTAEEYARSKGYDFKIGTSCEFYVCRTDDDGLPLKIPHDNAGYCDAAPFDKGENLRRDICLTLEQMDILPENSHHEAGPGQNEINFECSQPLNAADNFVTFKNVTKTSAARGGLYASFMPKLYKNEAGSGLHISIDCRKNGKDIFAPIGGELSEDAGAMIMGLMENIPDITVFLNSVPNSYARLGCGSAPKYISWSHYNFSQLIRLPNDKNGGRLILTSPDSTCSPYFAIGLIIYACLDGINRGLKLCESVDKKLSDDAGASISILPQTLIDAAERAKGSAFVEELIDEKVIEYFTAQKTELWEEYRLAKDKEGFESAKYFPVV